MKYNNIILLLALCSTNLFAAGTPVPYTFTAGDTIRASDINANFQELANRIDAQQSSGGKLYVFSTPTTYAANTGRKAFNEHCEGIDPSATMCTVDRVVNAHNTIGVTYASGFQGGWVDSWGAGPTNCYSWGSSSAAQKGSFLSNTGGSYSYTCDIYAPVACCK